MIMQEIQVKYAVTEIDTEPAIEIDIESVVEIDIESVVEIDIEIYVRNKKARLSAGCGS